MIKVRGYDTLYRDSSSGAIINKDNVSAEQALKRHELREVETNRISKLEDKLDHIEMLLEKLVES